MASTKRRGLSPSDFRRALGCYLFLAVAAATAVLVALVVFTKRDEVRAYPLTSGKAFLRHFPDVARTGVPANAHNFGARAYSPQSATGLNGRMNGTLRSGESWEDFCRDILPDLIREDPTSVAAVILGLPAGYEREEALRLVSQRWGSRDGLAAMDWAAELSDADDRAASMANVSIGMSQTDPAAALLTAKQYGVADNGGLYQNMVALWAAKDVAGAFDWVDTLPNGPEKDAMMERVAYATSKTSPEDAVILATEEISDGPIRDDAVIAVLHQWAMRDLAAASSWVMQLPQGQLRDRAETQLQTAPRSST